MNLEKYYQNQLVHNSVFRSRTEQQLSKTLTWLIEPLLCEHNLSINKVKFADELIPYNIVELYINQKTPQGFEGTRICPVEYEFSNHDFSFNGNTVLGVHNFLVSRRIIAPKMIDLSDYFLRLHQ